MMNFEVIQIVCNTFDFWFKLWNLLLWSISFLWINIVTTDRYIAELIITSLGMIIPTVAAFFIDGMPMLYKVKRILIVVITIFYGIFCVIMYFTYQDVLIHPFEKYNFKNTQISLKSMFIGSYGNIILFFAKPLFYDINDMLKLLVRLVTFKDIHDQAVDRQSNGSERLVSVYKKPKIKWKHVNRV